MRRQSWPIRWARNRELLRYLTTWMLPVFAAGAITAVARINWGWQIGIYLAMVMAARWVWQLEYDIRGIYRQALLHADEAAAQMMPSSERRYVAVRAKRPRYPGVWAVVVYDEDSIRMYQGLGKTPSPPGRAEKSRFAWQTG